MGARTIADGSETRRLVARYLRTQRDALVTAEPQLASGEVDAVHDARVAVRRLRATLRTFRPLLDRPRSEPLRAELAWWGDLLGAARDAEVARDRVAAVLLAGPTSEPAAEPTDEPAGEPTPELVEDPALAGDRAGAALVAHLDRAYRKALAEAVAHLGEGPGAGRYLALRAELDEVVEATEATTEHDHHDRHGRHDRHGQRARSARSARSTPSHDGTHRVRKAFRRTKRREAAVRELVEAAVTDPLDPHLADRVHALRRATKRARYAAEVLAPAVGQDADRFVAACARLQDALGAHHDAAGLVALLTADAPHEDWAGAFEDGVLVGAERTRAAEALAAYPALWSDVVDARWWV